LTAHDGEDRDRLEDVKRRLSGTAEAVQVYLDFFEPSGIKRPFKRSPLCSRFAERLFEEDIMTAFTRVALFTIGGLLSFIGAADAHRHERHAMTRYDYSGFESRTDWQARSRSGFAVRSQPVSNDLVAKPEGSGQPGSP
jgi:hypothetical protein